MALLKHYDRLHSARTAEEYASILPDLAKLELDVEMTHVTTQLDAYSGLVERQKERNHPNLENNIQVVDTYKTKQRLLLEEQTRRSED